MTKVQAGLKPKQRKLAVKKPNKQLTANQWQNTPQQNLFMQLWLEPTSPTFANAYKSALEAGYNERYAAQIVSGAVSNKWIQDYKRLSFMQMEHLEQRLSRIITERPDSKSPDDTVIKAIELVARLKGYLTSNTTNTVNIVTPILAGSSVKGTVIEATLGDTDPK